MLFQCERCRKDFDVWPSRAKHGRAKHCSKACQYATANGRTRHAIPCQCQGCGTVFQLAVSKVFSHKGAGSYCTRSCRDKHRVGAAIPNYRGGCVKTYTRGQNWQSQRRAALKRDGYICQECWSPDRPQVHHVIPFRLFEHYTEANQLSNLLTLCPPCHRIADAKIQKAGL